MRPLPAAFALLALLAALVAMGLLLLQEEPRRPETIDPAATRVRAPVSPGTRVEMVRGGIYGGIVVDEDDQPIQGAVVLLVAYDSGEEALASLPADPESFDISQIAVIGFRTAAETTTDAAGRFRVAADADAAIRVVAAAHPGHVPELAPVSGPGDGIRVVLQPAGLFVGHVIDDAGAVVAGAEVSIYLQNRAVPAPVTVGERVLASPKTTPATSPFAAAQRWVARELGPRVWQMPWQGDDALHTHTDRDGTFRFGPIGDEVQLEFVVTHPEFMWTELDRKDHRVQRTVVAPGETVERTFRLERGRSIEGRVVDESGNGVKDVLVGVEHVAQYAQHWWYRTRTRKARTGRDGSFRVAGLSHGPYTAVLEHPAFGREFIPSIPQDAKDLQWHVQSLGALEGRVEGLPSSAPGARITLVLESAAADADAGTSRHERFQPRLAQDGTFVVRGIRPGRWRAWVQTGGMSSQPIDVDVTSLGVAPLTFVLGGGGQVRLRVWDAGDRVVDPASVLLVRLEGEVEQTLGRFVTRGGRLDASGIVPGRYRCDVSAPGYLPSRTEPFEVRADGASDAGDVTLRQPATLRIEGILGADGRPATIFVQLSVKEEGATEFRPLPPLGQSEVPVRPGSIVVRAKAQDGSAFEATFEAPDGGILPVMVRLED